MFLNVIVIFYYPKMVLWRGHDRCVLICALVRSCHPDFNGAEQVLMPLSNSLRNHNQADLCNGQIHTSH